jgi:hypothetical protein
MLHDIRSKHLNIAVHADGTWNVAGAGVGHGIPPGGRPGQGPAVAAAVPAGTGGGVTGSYRNGPAGLGRWLKTEDSATVSALAGAVADAFKTAAVTGGGGFGGGGGALGGDAAANKALARSMFPWPASMWPAFDYLEMREAGYNRFARNSSSGAYGIPQALPPTKMPFAAQAAGGSHAGAQLGWMFSYIGQVYGNPVAAAQHERAVNWYGNGLDAVISKPTLIGVGERGAEHVSVTPAGGGRARKVVIEFRFGDSEFDRFMMRWMRKSARIEGGGNVQVAFGA